MFFSRTEEFEKYPNSEGTESFACVEISIPTTRRPRASQPPPGDALLSMASTCPPCTLRRSDGETGHDHWLKSENKAIIMSSKRPQQSYHGGCDCEALTFEFQTMSVVDSNSTFYTCDCKACFKRGYLFYVIPIKHFKFTSRCPSDLGTYATTTGLFMLETCL